MGGVFVALHGWWVSGEGLKEEFGGGATHVAVGLPRGSELWGDEDGGSFIIEAGDGDPVGDAHVARGEFAQDGRSQLVECAEDCVDAVVAVEEFAQFRAPGCCLVEGGIDDERFIDGQFSSGEDVPVCPLALLQVEGVAPDGWAATELGADKDDAGAVRLEQVLDDLAGPGIVGG